MLLIFRGSGGYREQKMSVIPDIGSSTGMFTNHQRDLSALKRKCHPTFQTVFRPGLGRHRPYFRKLTFGPFAMLMQERQGARFADGRRYDEFDAFRFCNETQMLGPSAVTDAIRHRKAC